VYNHIVSANFPAFIVALWLSIYACDVQGPQFGRRRRRKGTGRERRRRKMIYQAMKRNEGNLKIFIT
jgi:hypothetical protein